MAGDERAGTTGDGRREVVLLGAGRPLHGDVHTALREAGRGSRVLDWLLQALAPAAEGGIQFVGGYQMEAVSGRYPSLRYVENPDWRETGAAGSLFRADLPDDGPLLVSYSDILYRRGAVGALEAAGADVAVAVDGNWRERYHGRRSEDLARCEKVNLAGRAVARLGADIPPARADAEFIGLVRFSPSALRRIRELRTEDGPDAASLARENLSGLVEWLRVEGAGVRAVDVRGDWAELNEPRDLARFVLGTKAETLERLRDMVRQSRIEPQVAFTVDEWRADPQGMVERIRGSLSCERLVVRSSALSEDGFSAANAGAYTSVLGVPAGDAERVAAAVEEVIASYSEGGAEDQVLVQPMVEAVAAAGVAFTRTLSHGAPYYVIDYDDVSGETDSITGGGSRGHHTLVVRRDVAEPGAHVPAPLEALIPALREIESLLDYDSLDVEFAIGDEGSVHVLQVRPIAVDHSGRGVDDEELRRLIEKARERFDELQPPSPFVLGERTLFGVMPDWNPAEIIGTTPGRLAVSLYRYLITDEVWAAQRAELGYRDVRPQPLLVSLAGRPFVDVRASFNSFVPAELDDELAERLVGFYLERLRSRPELHDKVEFEVVPTCYALDFARWERLLAEEGGFSRSDVSGLREALRRLTVRTMEAADRHRAAVDVLERRFEVADRAGRAPLDRARLLLDDCRLHGTPPFAHLARSAFVAVTLLRSAVHEGVLEQADVDDFLGTIRTVSHRFASDAWATADGRMEWSDFVSAYGHLRPGTYDVTSPCYAADPARYLTPVVEGAESPGAEESHGARWEAARPAFAEALARAGLPADAEAVEAFMRTAIEGREYAKFAFSRNLSGALEALATFGEAHGVDRGTLADIGIEELFAFGAGVPAVEDVRGWLLARAEEGAASRRMAAAVVLPPLLRDAADFTVFSYPATRANFVGGGTVTAPCVELADPEGEAVELAGKIAMTPRADPGYDWLFARGIVGLVTMYGGANSHMAIRAAEFGLPAAIGVGEPRYRTLLQASVLELNAGNGQIHVVG